MFSRKPKSKRQSSGLERNQQHKLELMKSSLVELRASILAIEKGNNLACRTVASLLQRILLDELPVATQGRKIKMLSHRRSSDGTPDPFPLTVLEVTEYGTRIVPTVFKNHIFNILDLQRWKTEKVIFGSQASALYGLDVSNMLKEDFSREKLLRDIRNEIGAHVDSDISAFFKIAFQDYTFVNFQKIPKSADTNSLFRSPPHRWNFLSATISAIAVEFLKSIDIVEKNNVLLLINPAAHFRQ
ncbi:MAG: hypothetical protein JJU08_02915 [Rhodobacteraceae bacterium]|nr:hypothetical protein [Paracoccaceae bacterium]